MSRIGVLALQGDVREHVNILESLDADALEVKKPDELLEIDALILPGGESTTIAKMAVRFGLIEPIRSVIDDGLRVAGTCAGLLLSAGTVSESAPRELAALAAGLCGPGPIWGLRYLPTDVIPGYAFWLYARVLPRADLTGRKRSWQVYQPPRSQRVQQLGDV